METLIGTTLQVKVGEEKPTTSFKPHYWAFYFGAHWAPPCRKFTNDLTEFYEKVNNDCPANEKNLEVIFISMDGNKDHFERNFGLMPWFALPYTDEARVSALKVKYDITALPTLIVVNSTGEKTVSNEGRQYVLSNDTIDEVLIKWKAEVDKVASN